MPFIRKDGLVKPHRFCLRATPLQADAAKILLRNLDENRLRIVLVPQPRQYDYNGLRKLRAVSSRNPDWYSKMARARGYSFRGKKKRYGNLRNQVKTALERLVSGWISPKGLEMEILRTAKTFLRDMGIINSDADADQIDALSPDSYNRGLNKWRKRGQSCRKDSCLKSK